LHYFWETIKFKQLTHIDCGVGAAINCLRLIGKGSTSELDEIYQQLLREDSVTYILDIAHLLATTFSVTLM
jgi:hypothetical protein